ncbi:MAG: dUTP diphosphatase [Treponema sp.]|nr:dUTP diphosphatase [Treponema sp.]
MELKILRLDARIPLPEYQTEGAAGMDLRAYLKNDITLPPQGRIKVPTGLRMEIPAGYEGQVRPRSGLAIKSGLTVLNSPGTIDSDYRGDVEVILVNLSDKDVIIKDGERIAQLVIAPVVRVRAVETQILQETKRGTGGFGSTG